LQYDIFTEGNQGNEATGVGLRQISKQALLLPLMTEASETLRYLLFKIYRDQWALRYKQKTRFLARLGMTISPVMDPFKPKPL
jgi:hypothetical protein